ncbi:MFS transporter [Paenibacillus rhizovicinus]|uniref:MFS transporter n=2 Tax=Paenibacillus rhizovicinus TaxID=2704463 RepID=A0A6C0PA07_9BACL|nr:MFS transporter [Paenibacillus rhizovicinus]
MFLYGIGSGILAPMNAVYMRDGIGLSKVEIASIFSISLLFNLAATIAIGLISDRMAKKKRLTVYAVPLCMAGLLLYMQADGYALALLGLVLASAPSGLIMGQLFAMARNHMMLHAASFFEMAQIWLRATLSVGFFTGLLAGANVYLFAGFRGVLWGNLLGYALLFLCLLLYKENEGKAAKNVSTGEPFSLVMLAALLLLCCADSLRGLYLPLVVVQLFERPQTMSYLWSVQAVFELLFMTLAGYWAARYGSKRIMILSSFFALVVYATYAFSPPMAVFFLVQPLYSFFVSVLYGVAMGYVQRMFHSRVGFGSSVYVSLTQTASLIGYLLPFLVPGYRPAIFAIPATLVLAALLIIGASAYWTRTKTRGHKVNAIEYKS